MANGNSENHNNITFFIISLVLIAVGVLLAFNLIQRIFSIPETPTDIKMGWFFIIFGALLLIGSVVRLLRD